MTTNEKIREMWRQHPLYLQGKIELAPTEWVWKFYGPDVSPVADLRDGTFVTMDELWANIQEVGLFEPLIMRVGVKSRTFRLESGNHRIQLFHQHGVPFVPLTIQVKEDCGPHLGDVMTDASHNFDAESDDLLISNVVEEYMAPSKVFSELRKEKGSEHLVATQHTH